MKQVYIASPFFNTTQIERVQFIKTVLDSLHISYYSPMDEAVVQPNDQSAWRTRVFQENCSAIDQAQLVIVVTDDKDMGTLFEAGYAYKAKKPILYFAETLGKNQFNLMLAESGLCVAKTREQLVTYLHHVKNRNFLRLNKIAYEGEIE